MYTTTIVREFDAAHQNGPPDGKCARMHGHTWVVQVDVQMLDKHRDQWGWTVDFGKLKAIIDSFDHQLLNAHDDLIMTGTSAESIAQVIYRKVDALLGERAWRIEVKVQEGPGSWVVYDGPDPEGA